MSSLPKTLYFFAITMLFLFLLSDLSNIGITRTEAKSGVRNGTDSAIRRSVEQGVLQNSKQIRIDNQKRKEEWLSSVVMNAGSKATEAQHSAIYPVADQLPFLAAQVGIPYRSHAARLLNEPDQYIPRHRVIFIWDEK